MKNLLLTLFIIIWLKPVFSQIEILNSKVWTARNFEKAYVILNVADSKEAEEYKRVFKEYWKLTPIEIIDYRSYPDKIEPDALYFTFRRESYITPGGSSTLGNRTTINYGNSYSYFYMELFTIKEKRVDNEKEKRRQVYDNRDAVKPLARIFLGFNSDVKQDGSLPLNAEIMKYNGGNLFPNWRPGFIKNYLQQLQRDLIIAEDKKTKVFVSNPIALKALKNDTLYTPHKDLKKYPYKTKVIDMDELSNKILNEKESFYYLLSVSLITTEFTYIANSKTGEIIFQLEHPRNKPYMLEKLIWNINKKVKEKK